MEQRVLREIAETLNAGSWNYTVFLELFEVSFSEPMETDAIIRMALGAEATLGGIEDVQKASVWPVLENSLLYCGDDGAGPSPTAIKSEKLAALIGVLRGQVAELVTAATSSESFWLRDGHPAYPVFWDFAFLFKKDANATILIGSSSD